MAVERARAQVAALVGGNPEGVVFTSGATEANHLGISGLVRRSGRRRVVANGIEHPCVQAAVAGLGAEVVRWRTGADGRVCPEPVDEQVGLIALMAANHETGVVQPLERAWEIARFAGAFFHVDATQAAGRIALDLKDADGVALSSHKLGGPGGVGALVLRDGEPFPPIFGGGSQERGRRSGTVNVVGVVGFGEACDLARRHFADESRRLEQLSTLLRVGLVQLGARVVGGEPRLPNTTTVVFPEVLGESMVQALDIAGICVSSGAACASGSVEPSPVLLAMGDPEPTGGVRFSLGWSSTSAEVEQILSCIPGVLEGLRWR